MQGWIVAVAPEAKGVREHAAIRHEVLRRAARPRDLAAEFGGGGDVAGEDFSGGFGFDSVDVVDGSFTIDRHTKAIVQAVAFGYRSAVRRVGKEWVSTCRSRWSP